MVKSACDYSLRIVPRALSPAEAGGGQVRADIGQLADEPRGGERITFQLMQGDRRAVALAEECDQGGHEDGLAVAPAPRQRTAFWIEVISSMSQAASSQGKACASWAFYLATEILHPGVDNLRDCVYHQASIQ